MHKYNLLGKSKISVKETFLSFPLLSGKTFLNLLFWENQVSWRLTLARRGAIRKYKAFTEEDHRKGSFLDLFSKKSFLVRENFVLSFYCLLYTFLQDFRKIPKIRPKYWIPLKYGKRILTFNYFFYFYAFYWFMHLFQTRKMFLFFSVNIAIESYI